jgi:hypothetical protein
MLFSQNNGENGITVVDLCSNLGGMMILLACLGLAVHSPTPSDSRPNPVNGMKPIDFPLTNVPAKRPIVLCLRFGCLYDLMDAEKAAMQAIAAKAHSGTAVQGVRLTKNGVRIAVDVLSTAEGFFLDYTLVPDAGIPLADQQRVCDKLIRLQERFPPHESFFDLWVWPDSGCYQAARDILSWLHTAGFEAGWSPQPADDDPSTSVAYYLGEGTATCRSFTSQ